MFKTVEHVSRSILVNENFKSTLKLLSVNVLVTLATYHQKRLLNMSAVAQGLHQTIISEMNNWKWISWLWNVYARNLLIKKVTTNPKLMTNSEAFSIVISLFLVRVSSQTNLCMHTSDGCSSYWKGEQILDPASPTHFYTNQSQSHADRQTVFRLTRMLIRFYNVFTTNTLLPPCIDPYLLCNQRSHWIHELVCRML